MSAGPLSPGTRRRLLQGQTGPLPEFPSNSVAIFISSTVSGKGQGKAGLGFSRAGGTRGVSGNGHGSQCPLRHLDVKAARPVSHVGTSKGEHPRPPVSSLIIQAESFYEWQTVSQLTFVANARCARLKECQSLPTALHDCTTHLPNFISYDPLLIQAL